MATVQAVRAGVGEEGAPGAVSALGGLAAASARVVWALFVRCRWQITVALLLLTPIEMLARLAVSQQSRGLIFVGTFWAFNDPPQYFSAMRQGAASSSWLIYDRFSQEPHAPALLYPLYVGLGKLAALLGWGIEATFADATLLSRIFLVLSVYAATKIVTNDRATRRAAFLLVLTSSGVAGMLAIVQTLTGWAVPLEQLEREHPELNTFLLLFTAPHLIVGMGLLLFAARLYSDCWGGAARGRHLLLAGTVIALGFTNPFALVPFTVVVLVHGLTMAAYRRRMEWAGHGGLVVALLAAAPALLGNIVTFTFDPFWSRTYGGQNVTAMPPIQQVALALGCLIPLAVFGLPALVRTMTPGRLLVLLWVSLAIVLMHAPTSIQRRFGIGLHPMLALLAADGALRCWRALRRPDWGQWSIARPILLTGAFQTVVGTSVATYLFALSTAIAPSLNMLAPDEPGAFRSPYQPVVMAEAAEWLTANGADDDVVLGSVLSGNYLAGVAPTRMYAGHWVATLNYGEKAHDVLWFYSRPFDEKRRAFLARSGVRYVVYGPHERRMGGDPGQSPALRAVFSTPDLVIFEVAAGASAPASTG